MKKLITVFTIALVLACIFQTEKLSGQTYCNPMNLSYRFCLDKPSRREAADPTMVLYKDNYYLFASKSGGYWYSSDLLGWNMVSTSNLPIENYAPTAVVIGDWLYFFTSQSNTIYRTNDPVSGKWEIVNDSFPIVITDPDIFADTDGRVYFYYGCSNKSPLQAIELDVNNKLNPIGKPVDCIFEHADEHGWERTGNFNQKPEKPWIEGSWMNKYKGKYYLQYAGPGTEFKSYGDGVYVSDQPLGPFTYALNNPFSYKPEGFTSGAGHGSTFADKYGNYWHIATMTISVKHMFERRLILLPTGFDKAGNLFTRSDFGDYPIIIPNHKYKNVSELNPGWMLLSYKKPVSCSSQLAGYPVENAVNEDIRTYWSAQTGNKGEWMSVDLGSLCTIQALQLNFAENNTELHGRDGILAHQYLLEYSDNNILWKTASDQSANTADLTHQYLVMNSPIKARYLKVTNLRVPGGTFAISGFRVFGTGTTAKPAKINTFEARRLASDPCVVELSWNKTDRAVGYMIRYGAQKDQLHLSYQVYGDTSLTIRSLNKKQDYWFQIDAFGENGCTSGVPQKVAAIGSALKNN